MQPLQKRLDILKDSVAAAVERLRVAEKAKRLLAIESELTQPDTSAHHAGNLAKEAAGLRNTIEPWQALEGQIGEVGDFLGLADDTLQVEIGSQLDSLESTFEELKKDLLFDGEYDDHDVILRITAGVGGTDAQDWAEMLERMYLRWAEKSAMKAKSIERSKGEEAGIKTSVIELQGPYAYGKLKSEHGVHRLVRLSPFNSDNLRQTSFALVEVLPQIDAPEEAEIDDKDLKIDVYRAGGHGGQSVNTTDSAVRITHLPTNTVVAIQNERSQLQNKETALKLLRSKLAQLKLEQHAETLSDLRAGESANWGSQIRNYVLHPYTLVKDTRTKYEDKDAKSVLDGKLDGFMTSYLEQQPNSQ